MKMLPCYGWLQNWDREAEGREQSSVTPYTPARGSVEKSRLGRHIHQKCCLVCGGEGKSLGIKYDSEAREKEM